MPEISSMASANYQAEAIAKMESWLIGLGEGYRKLEQEELNTYSTRNAIHGWRLPISFAGGIRNLDILIDSRFPHSPARIVLVDRPEFLTWPHIEKDGVICLLSENATINVYEPIEVVKCLLNESCVLIEDLIAGKRQEDFYEEFYSYWDWCKTPQSNLIYSLITPSPPARMITLWKGKKFYLIGNNKEDVLRWLTHKNIGYKNSDYTVDRAVFLWIRKPLIPKEYPKTASDIFRLIKAKAPEGMRILEQLLLKEPNKINLIIGAPTSNGPCLSSITVPAPDTPKFSNKTISEHLNRGFRPGKTPPSILAKRYAGNVSVERSNVDRADAEWVHGRGQDKRINDCREKNVVIIGCGSVGAAVAIMLAQAGIGKITLIDYDDVKWANISRNPLGAESIGRNKALALRDRILSSYPHIKEVLAHTCTWEEVLNTDQKIFESYDLIISATGNWGSQSSLNNWHLLSGRKIPIIYGWTEAHACAGHAVAVTSDSGCLQCGFKNFGEPLLRVTEWPNGSTVKQEPACGAIYQPYGPIELSYTVGLISMLVLDCVLEKTPKLTHRIWAGPIKLLENSGGRWTSEWLEIMKDRLQGGFNEEREWTIRKECPECQ